MQKAKSWIPDQDRIADNEKCRFLVTLGMTTWQICLKQLPISYYQADLPANQWLGGRDSRMNTFVILLRGITPTGKNKVPMAPLREALADAGLGGVRTYIQSGNVIATSDLMHVEMEKLVHDVIHRSFGGDIAVLARTAKEFANILKRCPFTNIDRSKLYCSLLAANPDKELLKEFLSTDFSPDQVRFVSHTIYTLYATKHGDSKFNNNYFERKLKVTATTQNLNTMSKLAALAAAQRGTTIDEHTATRSARG